MIRKKKRKREKDIKHEKITVISSAFRLRHNFPNLNILFELTRLGSSETDGDWSDDWTTRRKLASTNSGSRRTERKKD